MLIDFEKANSENGFVYIVGSIVLIGLVLLMFASVQYTNGVRESLHNYYTTVLASQQMRTNTPFKDSALAMGAWVGLLNGFAGLQDIDALQNLPGGGQALLQYDDTSVPHKVKVFFKEPLSLLDKFFTNVAPGVGLSTLETAAELGSTSQKTFLSIHIDNSLSMRGPPQQWQDGPSVIDNLVASFNLPLTQDISSVCYPIDVEDYMKYYPTIGGYNSGQYANLARLLLCRDRARMLPFFYSQERALPINYYFDHPRPVPPDIEKSPPLNPNPNGNKFEYYNPGFDYSQRTPEGDMLLTCSSQWVFHDPGNGNLYWCIPNDPNGAGDLNQKCFPLDTSSDQFALNGPGLRHVEFYNEEAQCQQGTGACRSVYEIAGEITGCSGDACRRDPITKNSYDLGDQDFCVRPWRARSEFMTDNEKNFCQGSGPPPSPELPSPGCNNQFSMLYAYMSDFFQSYIKLSQAFLMSAVDTVPFVNVSSFSGPTRYGMLQNTDDRGQPLTGNHLLFDSSKYSGNMYQESIDTDLKNLMTVNVNKIPGPGTILLSTTLGYDISSGVRFTHMLGYLDRAKFPVMNPDPNTTGTDIVHAKHSFPGTTALAPLDNPNYEFVSPQNYGGVKVKGRCATYEQKQSGVHPTDIDIAKQRQYSFWNTWDKWDDGSVKFFPEPRNRQELTTQYGYTIGPYDTSYDGFYDWPSLKAIDWQTGQQLPSGADYTEETWIRNLAPCVVNYITPTPGGTDTISAFQAMLDGYKSLNNSTISGVGVVITDGKPEYACDTNAGKPDGLQCANPIPPYGPASDPSSVLGQIKAILDELRDVHKMTVILLYINQETGFDQEVEDFLDLFRNEPNRILFEFKFSNTVDFTQKFKEALTAIAAILKTLSLPI